jgi:hypothetical protein
MTERERELIVEILNSNIPERASIAILLVQGDILHENPIWCKKAAKFLRLSLAENEREGIVIETVSDLLINLREYWSMRGFEGAKDFAIFSALFSLHLLEIQSPEGFNGYINAFEPDGLNERSDYFFRHIVPHNMNAISSLICIC